MHFLLIYEVASDYVKRRAEFRNDHLTLAWQAHERGELILGGALTDPPDQALLLFQGETSEAAERFAAGDPYVLNGLVKKWTVRHWATVVGEMASAPIRPARSPQ
jgi:uncharacterized protein